MSSSSSSPRTSSSEGENCRFIEKNLAGFFGLTPFEPSALDLIPPTPPSPTGMTSLHSTRRPSALRRPSIGTVHDTDPAGRRQKVEGSPPLRVTFADEVDGGRIATHWEIPSLVPDDDRDLVSVRMRRRGLPNQGVARPDFVFPAFWRILSLFQGGQPENDKSTTTAYRKSLSSHHIKGWPRRTDTSNEKRSQVDAHKERETRGIIVLLLSPAAKQFELVNIYFDGSETTQLSRVLELVPKSATYAALRKQRYVGFCRPLADFSNGTHRDDVGAGRELVNSLTLREHGVRPNDVLIAIPQGFRGMTCAKLAKPILNDPKMTRLVQRLKQKQKGFPRNLEPISTRRSSFRHIRRTLRQTSSVKHSSETPRKKYRVVLLFVTCAVYVTMLSLAVAKAVLPSHKLYALGFFMEDAKADMASYWALATLRSQALFASFAAVFPSRVLPWSFSARGSRLGPLGPTEEVVVECNARFGTQTIGCIQWASSEDFDSGHVRSTGNH